jgi:asparagine synthase (glutamine-hydrolysing)
VFVDSVKDIIPSEVWQRKKIGFEMPFAEWMNGRLNKKFLEAINKKKAEDIFQINYLNSLDNRVKSKNLKRLDWMSLVFLSWLDRYEVEI